MPDSPQFFSSVFHRVWVAWLAFGSKSEAIANMSALSAEQVQLLGPDQLRKGTFTQRVWKAAHVHSRYVLIGLAHQQRCRCCQLIHHRHLGYTQLVAEQIGLTPQVYHPR